jgi:serpin B
MPVIATVAAASLALAGCVAPTISGVLLVPSGRPARAADAATSSDPLVGAIDDFGLALLHATSADSGVNVVVSPASVHAALSMTVNGATGETAEQMRKVLRTDSMSPAEADAQWASLLAGLASRSSDQTLEIADALFARKGVAFKKPFVQADRDSFGAQISTLDFGKDDVAGIVNRWVSDNTHGMITKMVGQVPPNAILYLANAVYFKGDWQTPFKHEATGKQPFTRADGSKVTAEMMNLAESLPYYENAQLQATSLPYKGGDAAYYVILPKPGVKLDAALTSLSGSGFRGMRTGLDSADATEVVLGLPKLDTDFGISLRDALIGMGMPRAFDERSAQFSGMADLDYPIYIGDVIHKTKVKVDEQGTVAAAATVVAMETGAAAPSFEPKRIVCDRPYGFAIVDRRSGAMLFLGAVNDPTR